MSSQHAASDNERLGHLNSKEEELPTREYSLNPPVAKIKVVKKEHQQDIFSASYDNNIPDRQNKTAFITFSHMGNITKFNRIILAAVKTWIPKDEVYYVVLNHQWNQTFSNWKNDMIQKNETMVNLIQPIFVDCTESRRGESTCCKQEKGLIEFYDKYFHERNYDWVYFADDDMFINTKLLFEYMEVLPYGLSIEHARLMENGPFVLLSEGYLIPHPLGWGPGKYKCEQKDASYLYPWGQPVMYNRHAMNKIIVGLRLGGLVKQCIEFDVNHDVGNAIFHWMYSLPYSSFPRTQNLKQLKMQNLNSLKVKMKRKMNFFRKDTVGIHGIDIEDYFSQENFWSLRLNDSIRAFTSEKDKLPPEEYFGFGNLSGFHSTDTFSMYGSPDEWTEKWHTMNRSDCIKKR